MNWLHKHWKRTPSSVRKPLVFALGFTIVGVGILLIPLPGPGWVIVFAGFAVLASEFEFAERIRDKLIAILKHLVAYAQKIWKTIQKAFTTWMRT